MSISSAAIDRLRQAIADFISVDAQQLQQRIGRIVVGTTDDPQYAEVLRRTYLSDAMVGYDPGNVERDPTTVFFADRIPAGIEEQVILREMLRLHGRRVCEQDWELVTKEPERWDTWGRQSVEGRIYDAVSDRIKQSRRDALPSLEEVRFVFSVQEAVVRGVEPIENGRGAGGWLHAVCDTVRESAFQLLGRDLSGHGPRDIVKLLQFGSPFDKEIGAMKWKQRMEAEAQRAAQRHQQLLSSRVARMERIDAKFVDDQTTAPLDCEGALRQRIADLTRQLKGAQAAIKSLAYEENGSWYLSGDEGSEVTSCIDAAAQPLTMASALWDIKELVGNVGNQHLSRDQLVGIEVQAYAGLETAVGTPQQRASLKEILTSVQHSIDTGAALAAGVVTASVSKGVPAVVEAVAPANPFVHADTWHRAEMTWTWSDEKRHDSDFKNMVLQVIELAVEQAEDAYSVLRNTNYRCQWEGVEFQGRDLVAVTNAANRVAQVLMQFDGVEPLEPWPLVAGDKVFVKSEQKLATVLDVYGDGLRGDHGDVRLDLCGNTPIADIERYNAAKHGAYDHTFVPIKREWKEAYGIAQDVPLRDEEGQAERTIRDALQTALSVFDRLAEGEDFNALIEETGATNMLVTALNESSNQPAVQFKAKDEAPSPGM